MPSLRPSRAVATCALLVAATLGLSGCGDLFGKVPAQPSSDARTSDVSADPAGQTEHGGEDDEDAEEVAAYLKRMVQFTRQQQALADLALARSKDPEVRQAAGDMKALRRHTIGELTAALAKLHETPPEASAAEGGGWPGMLTENQLRALGTAEGTQFDRLWPSAVAATDEAAITLSRAQFRVGDDEEDRELAMHMVEHLSGEYTAANRLAGPLSQRAELPPR